MKHRDMDSILLILLATMVFFTICMFSAEVWFGSDGQFFQVISNLLTGVTGAFLARIKPSTSSSRTDVTDTPEKTTVSTVSNQ